MSKRYSAVAIAVVAMAALAVVPNLASADGPTFDLYGHAMLDMGYESGQSDPNWFDVMRPTKLPSYEGEFGGDGHTYAGVRQSRFGVQSVVPTGNGDLKVLFEFELFGVGTDEGQTTFRLRHAWGEYNMFGAGQTWSPFMDPDVFPNSIEYWGPNAMVFFRNVQFRYMPVRGENELFIALERPGASGDPGVQSGHSEVAELSARFPLPDLSAHYRRTADWGHVQIAGILRRIVWDDADPTPVDASGETTGWGVNLSSNLKLFKSDVLRVQVVYGEGVQNYMNDATADVGATGDDNIAEPLPLLGVVAFYDHTWSEEWTSTAGYSVVDIDNSAAQDPSDFKRGQYALVNLLNHSIENLMWGAEVQWGDRENFSDGFSSDDLRVQFSFKYSFGKTWSGDS